jgi:hypothetical protein
MRYGLVDRYSSGHKVEQQVPIKCWYLSAELYSGRSQETVTFIETATKTSSLNYTLNKIVNAILLAGNYCW